MADEEEDYDWMGSSFLLGKGLELRYKLRRRRRGAGTGGDTAVLLLDVSSFAAGAPPGTVVGNLSVFGGTGTYVFGFTSNPGLLFSISGNQIRVASPGIAAGTYPVTVQGNNGAGSIVTATFTLTATGNTVGQGMGLLLALTYAV